MSYYPEQQITKDFEYNHDLDNNDNFSPDNEWLVYDTRTEAGGIAASSRIEKVNIKTGEKKVVFQVENNQDFGPGVGAVSYSPVRNEVVFIHGLRNCTEENPYQQWRRTGVIVDEDQENKSIFMDARNVNFPFTKGALRGGTHRHEFSADGNWIGFTYNDAIMHALEKSTGGKHNLRTIGVSRRGNEIHVKETNSGENNDGEWFSALVVKVVPNPRPGSDEIVYAAGDSWIGKNGYLKPDGTRQKARGFIGTVLDNSGKNVDEVFVVDIPEGIEIEGDFGSLEGTMEDLPMPPKGATQRRLTFTANSTQRGCMGIVRSNAEGSLLAFLAKDKNGIKQIFTIHPNGGKMIQVTFHDSDVEGSLRWHPDGERVFYVCKGSIQQCKIGEEDFEKRYSTISKPSTVSPTNLVISHDGKSLAFNRIVLLKEKKAKQIFVINLKN